MPRQAVYQFNIHRQVIEDSQDRSAEFVNLVDVVEADLVLAGLVKLQPTDVLAME